MYDMSNLKVEGNKVQRRDKNMATMSMCSTIKLALLRTTRPILDQKIFKLVYIVQVRTLRVWIL